MLNLKLDYIVKMKEKEIVRKSNTYKLLITMISCSSYMLVIRIKAPYLILIKISAMFFEAWQAHEVLSAKVVG